MKKIWVVGNQGMLARALLEELERRKIPFHSTAKEEVDITCKEAVLMFASKGSWSHIINCSGYTAVDLAEKEKKKAFSVNVDGVKNLTFAAEKSGSVLFHVSSDYVFDGKKKEPYREEDRAFPLSIYGKSKRLGEKALQKASIPYLLLRLSWLFGLGTNHFVAKILNKMKETKELFVVNDQRGKMTSVQDAASVMVDLLPYRGVYHFSNSGVTSWYEIACYIFQEAKRRNMALACEKIHPVSTDQYPALAPRPFYSALATEKIEGLLKRTFPSWKEAVANYLQKENFR
jgi:dTDP-4-dehydrorhamnose reductase